MTDTSNLDTLEAEVRSQIDGAADEAALDAVRVSALGKKGSVSLMMRELGKMSPEERQVMGPALNGLKTRLNDALEARKADLEARALDAAQVMEELAVIFADMGFEVAEGPDVEDDFHNFTALNFPPGHPARDTQDTFFMQPDANGERKVLRTHTSPVQIRTMLKGKTPIRIIVPGRVYRCDWDQTHTPMFHQVEGLVIDREANMGHLKGTLLDFIAAFFETDQVEARFRPHHFPFTEPSAEMDVRYERVGDAVKVGSGDKWMEILGCGMVHPNVIRNCGLDPDEFQGFAWGMGVDRLAMLKYGAPDLRDFFNSDKRWLNHYGFSPLLQANLATGLS